MLTSGTPLEGLLGVILEEGRPTSYIGIATLTSSSSASFPSFMWGRCFLRDASIEIGLALPLLTILSPTSRS